MGDESNGHEEAGCWVALGILLAMWLYCITFGPAGQDGREHEPDVAPATSSSATGNQDG